MPLNPAPPSGRAQGHSPSAVDGSRPFGAHLRMSWWKPLVLIVALPVVLVVLQVLSYQLVGIIEGSDDPMAPGFTPLKLLAINVSVGATGLLAITFLAWVAKVPWRSLISSPRAFDRRRLTGYLVGAALLVGVGLGVVAVVAPGSTGWTSFGITGTTVALLAITFLTTPIQAAGEELMYRSTVLPAAASWVRAARPALIVGLVVSSLSFALVHGSTDPWLAGYFVVVAVSTGLMAIISGGIEAPIAFHTANNVLAGILNSVMAGGGIVANDRTTDTGDASLLILVAVNVGMVVLVWVRERRVRATR